jgi:hypothetical protein
MDITPEGAPFWASVCTAVALIIAEVIIRLKRASRESKEAAQYRELKELITAQSDTLWADLSKLVEDEGSETRKVMIDAKDHILRALDAKDRFWRDRADNVQNNYGPKIDETVRTLMDILKSI